MGDKSVIPEIIDGHMKLIIHIASQYASYGGDGLDYISEGLLAAVTICNKDCLKDNEITGLIVCAVHRKISNYIARQRYKKKHEQVVSYKADSEINEGETKDYSPEKSEYGDYKLVDMLEIMELQIRSPEEREIVQLKREGYTLDEIAEKTGMSRTSVFRLFSAFQRRFKDALAE